MKSGQLSADIRLKLAEELQRQAREMQGEKMLVKLYEAALQWAEDHDFNLTSGTIVRETKSKDHKVNKQKPGKSRAQEQHVRGSKKLASMKTSEDVVNRILWDDNLPSEHFTVGYLDRFVGVVERAFSTFTWEDIASVDYDALAIPKHRIHYFKYRGIKVWDKELRLDDVFGSVGSGLTITDIIAQYEAGQLQCEEVAETPADEQEDSDDDDIVIKTGLEGEDVTYPRDLYWGPKKRPTHFLCLRVTNARVLEAVGQAEERILKLENLYRENLIPPHRLHITLACLGLDTPQDVDKATQLLHTIRPQLLDLQPSNIRVKFQGVDNFFNNVLYAQVQYNPDFLAFDHKLKLLLQEGGLEIRDVFEFVPHMTILKLKRDMQKELRTRYIEPSVYESLKGELFGEQVLDNIYLCEMSENRDEVGFYISPTHIKF